MADGERPGGFAFLYRQSEGTIGAGAWARAAWPPLAIALAIIAAWAWFGPSPPRPLTEAELRAGAGASALIFTIGFSLASVLSIFAIVLLAVAEYFVSGKRFRDLGLPSGLAGLAPMALLLAGAAHWYAARSGDVAAAFAPYVFDAIAAAVCAWTVMPTPL